MASRFGWVDQDDKQRQAMIAVVELFKDESTVDELGIGSIRDSLADTLFPGTSVLLTRARYLLMIPWLLQHVTASCSEPGEATAQLRELEARLIHSLLRGDEQDGLIGRQAKDELKRMPSAAYWNALGHFGLRKSPLSIEGLLRQGIGSRRAHRGAVTPDDPGAERDVQAALLHPDLPTAPEDLLTSSTLTLTATEADFLRDRMEKSSTGTLYAWLLGQGVPSNTAYVWRHEMASSFPSDAAEVVDGGRRFHTLVHGAALAYNSLLAREREANGLVEVYQDRIVEWSAELDAEQPLADGWGVARLWPLMARRGTPVRPKTQDFVMQWVAAVAEHGGAAATKPAVFDLVRQREIALKGGRARLVNREALIAWTGGSGLVRLDYRWAVAQRLMNDVFTSTQEAA